MNTENSIKTIFEFATEGYEKSAQELNDLAVALSTSKTNQKEFNKSIKDSKTTLDGYLKVIGQFEQTKTSDFTKAMRVEFEQTKKAVVEKQAAIVKDTEALRAQAKAQKEAEKAQVEAQAAAKTYATVMAELGKDTDKAQVSMSQLKEVQKALRSEFEKTATNTTRYKELSQELVVVEKAIKATTEAQRQQAKAQGVAENSIEGMRLKLSAMKAEWASLDRVLEKDAFGNKEKEIQAMNAELSEAENRVGVFSRNVGNYKSGFDGLGFSIAQITREAPAFAQSMNMGFLAISNNIPMLADQIKMLKMRNAEMNAEGQKTPSVWKSVAKSALSWNTALSVGVTLLTIYGGKLIGWVSDLFSAEDELERVERRTSELNSELGELNGTISKQTTSIQILSQKWVQLGGDIAAQQQFLEDNREELDKTGLAINSVADAQTALVDKLDEYLVYLSIKARAEAAYNLAIKKNEEAMSKALEAESEMKKGARWWEYVLAPFDTGVVSGQRSILDVLIGNVTDRVKEARDGAEKLYEEANFFRDLNITSEEDANKLFEKLGLKRIDTTKKIKDNEAKIYAQAHAERLQAQENAAKAEIGGDEVLVKNTLAILAHKQKVLDEAAKFRIKLSQSERDQLELNEYLSAQAIEKMREDATKKAEEEQKKRVDAYIKANADVLSAELSLLDAKKRGDAKEVALYQQQLAQKRAELEKYNAAEMQLTEEQQTEQDLANEQRRLQIIEGYKALKTAEMDLDNQFGAVKTIAEQQEIDKKRQTIQKQVEIQVQALQELGVKADEIVVESKTQADKVQQSMVDQLEKSLSTIEQFSGRSKNSFFKLSSSASGLLAGVFDLVEIKANKAGLTTQEVNKKTAEANKKIAEVGAATALAALNTVSDTLNAQFEKEKEQIDELYDYQTQAAQRSYDEQSLALDKKYKRGEITEAKYRLEQLKAERAQSKKQQEIDKQRANSQYELSVKMFRAKQAQDIIATIIATSVATMQTLAAGAGFFSSPLAIAVAAMGAVQVAMIAAQQPPEKPKFEKGGMLRFGTVEGESHANGGVPIKVGDKVVAEAEGDEGMLIISKKAMRNRHMRRLLSEVKQTNEDISGKNPSNTQLEQGGELTYEDFLDKAKAGVRVTFDHGFLGMGSTYLVNSEPVKSDEIDAKIEQAAAEQADIDWNEYIDKRIDQIENREASLTKSMDASIKGNANFAKMGIGSVADYNRVTASKEADLQNIEAQIDDYRKLADAKTDSLKVQLQYEEKLADFEKRKQDAAQELSDVTLAFNEQLLDGLHQSGQIATDEYLSMLDQVRLGYGVKTTDIINLKKKEVEEVKKLINEERNAEISAANETAKYRTDALAQLRTEWKDNYNATTRLIIEDVESASEAVAQLTGSDLERFEQIRTISREIQAMEDQYQKNDTLLSDGVVQSREERAELVAEQQCIKEELAIKEKEAEEARKAFEQERAKNMDAALKSYETANFDSLLSQIKELGSSLQTEGNKWSLDKQLASDLDGVLQGINSTYDKQIAAQDKIVDNLDLEIKKAQLLHDQKVAQIKAEEAAFKDSYEQKRAVIEAEFNRTTEKLRSQVTSLTSLLAQLRTTALAAGIGEYERSLEGFVTEIDDLKSQSKTFATGGVLDLGGGVFDVQGASHAQGGVPISIGGRKIAEVEGAEQMYIVNKLAAADPQMQAALARVSSLNEQYTGVPLHDFDNRREGYTPIDYDLLAQKIGQQINMRPVRSTVSYKDIRLGDKMDVIRRNINS